MAGLQSQNISIASTRAQRSALGRADGLGSSTSDARSTCVFCARKSYPPVSDPHAPVFAFFSLVDCPHYACQPCALVHCDNAGRAMECPSCHCVSRLAQTGKKRSASKKAEDEARRVGLDDGVSSVASRGSRRSARDAAAASAAAPRSALKGKEAGASKRRANSVQFPTDLAGRKGVSEDEEGVGGTSPLTASAVKALPVDPEHEAKSRGRRAEVVSDAGSSDHAVGLYSLSTSKPHRSSSSSRRRPPLPSSKKPEVVSATAKPSSSTSKERPHSQPAPQRDERVLPQQEAFTAPPPLRLHTIEEDEAAALPPATTTAPTTVDAQPQAEKSDSAAAEVVDMTPDDALLLTRVQQEELDACVGSETEERDIIEAAWRHTVNKLQAAKDDDWTAINTRRELEDDFALSPGGTPSPFTHANNTNTSLQTAPSVAPSPGAHAEAPVMPPTTADPDSAAAMNQGDSTTTRAKTPDESQVSQTSDDASQPSSVSKDGSGVGSKPSRSKSKKGEAAAVVEAPEAPVSEPATTANAATVSAGTSPIPDGRITTAAMDNKRDDDDDHSNNNDDDGTSSHAIAPTESAVSAITSAVPSETAAAAAAAAKRAAAADQLRVEQLEAVERYAIEDVEVAVRQNYSQLVGQLDDAFARARQAQAQAQAQVENMAAQATRDAHAREEESERAEIELEALRAFGALAADEARERVEAVREAAQREEEAVIAQRTARDTLDRRDSIVACEQTHEPKGRQRVQEEEEDARGHLEHNVSSELAIVAERQRARAWEQLNTAIDDLARDEEDDRFALRETERLDRRELRALLLHALASQRRAEAYAHDAWTPPEMTRSVAPQLAQEGVPNTTDDASWSIAPRPSDTSLVDPLAGSDESHLPVNRTQAALPHQQQQQQDVQASPSPRQPQQQQEEPPHAISPYTPSQTTPLSALYTPSQVGVRQLQEAEKYYQDEIGEAYARLREAQCRLQEEALARELAERQREAAQREAERIVEEAERNAADRIRRARLMTEQELNERLEAVRSESERRAAHDATLRALEEEEQRAVLEVKLLAAQRALDEAQLRAMDDLNRAREEAAVQAAAEAARSERRAREREAELEAKRHAENMLRTAQQENERELAAEQLRLVEARAQEAIARAREEAQQAAEDAQARFEALQQRQAVRAEELQDAQAHVNQAMEEIRAHESSHRTSPVNISAYSNLSAKHPVGDTSFDFDASQQQQQMYAGVQPRPPQASPPPRFSPPRPAMMQQPQQQPFSQRMEPPQATMFGDAQQPLAPSGVPSDIASSRASPLREGTLPPRASTPRGESGGAMPSTAPMTPRTMVTAIVAPMFAHFQELTDRLIQNTIREAAREMDAARGVAQQLRDDADQRMHESERRYRRRRADRDRVEQDLSVLARHSSAVLSSRSGAEPYESGVSAGFPSQLSGLAAAPSAVNDSRSGLGAEDSEAMIRSALPGSQRYRDPYYDPRHHSGTSAAARTLFFDQPSPLSHERQPRGVQEGGMRAQRVRSQYYQPPPFPYTAVRHPEALLAGHRYFFQRSTPFTAVPDSRPADADVDVDAVQQHHSHHHHDGVAQESHGGREFNSPSRRSQTRAEPDVAQHGTRPQQQQRPVSVRMDFSPGPTSSTGFSTSLGSSSAAVIPQADPTCKQCYREDTTSPCWQCGAMVCRRCGPPPGPKKLCCAAHFRGLKRARRAEKREKQAERAAHTSHPPLAPQEQQHAQRMAQTPLYSTAGAAAAHEHFPARRSTATSPIAIQADDNDSTYSDDSRSDAEVNQNADKRRDEMSEEEAVARLPDTIGSAESSMTSYTSGQPSRGSAGWIAPAHYRVHQHPYSPNKAPPAAVAQALPPSYSATPVRAMAAAATQTSLHAPTPAYGEVAERANASAPPMTRTTPAAAATATPEVDGTLSPSPHAPGATDGMPSTPPRQKTSQAATKAKHGETGHDDNSDDDEDASKSNSEPKTEKKSHGFFFVPLDTNDDGEPRRAKPPTPRNYQPSAPPHRHAQPTPSPAARRSLGGGGVPSRRTSPVARGMARPARQHAYPQQQQQRPQSRGFGAHRGAPHPASRSGPRRDHRVSVPYARDYSGPVKPAIHVTDMDNAYEPYSARDDDRVRAHRLHHVGGRHAAQPPSFTYYTPSTTSSATVPIDVVEKGVADAYGFAPSPPSEEVVRAAAELLASRRRGAPRDMVDTPESTPVPRGDRHWPAQEPRTCGKATVPSVHTNPYESDAVQKRADWPAQTKRSTTRTDPHSRYPAPTASDAFRREPVRGESYTDVRPSTRAAAALPTGVPARGAPTLEELDRRLRQLRSEDRHAAETYFAQQQQQRPQPLYNPDIYVNMMMPRGANRHGGNNNNNSGVAPTRSRSRNDARSRNQQAAVTPPWRTDDNSPAARQAWNVQQPRSPLYRPYERPHLA